VYVFEKQNLHLLIDALKEELVNELLIRKEYDFGFTEKLQNDLSSWEQFKVKL